MSDPALSPFLEQRRSTWIKLRTLIMIRWVAIFGQITAFLIAVTVYDLQFELILSMITIAVAIAVNLYAVLRFPENKRLTEAENIRAILFDLLQLGFLLFLTGGLQNPFSILLLAPVVVSASVLSLRSTMILGAAAIGITTVLSRFHYPLTTRAGDQFDIANMFIFGNWIAIVIALVFLSMYSRWITKELNEMGDALLATQMALSREQKLTDLGGVVAATAHELGTPLATIKLTSVELMEDLKDQPELYEDAVLIRDQASRCRDILHSMGRIGKSDKHLRAAPLSEILREAAEPHLKRGIKIEMQFQGVGAGQIGIQPQTMRRPEIIHGLRNLIQNAVDFSRSQVILVSRWDQDHVFVEIHDDGPGFSQAVLSRIGDPFMRSRRLDVSSPARMGYEGMGLGLFIAKTLLERSEAQLTFTNAKGATKSSKNSQGLSGAIVKVVWPRSKIESPKGALGENEIFRL